MAALLPLLATHMAALVLTSDKTAVHSLQDTYRMVHYSLHGVALAGALAGVLFVF